MWLVTMMMLGLGCTVDPECVDFCKDLGCEAEEADCGYDGTCACHGCTAYYVAVYGEGYEGTGEVTPPECDPDGVLDTGLFDGFPE
ncbi:MAG: hypothetical protein AAF211_02435 [Myxococcota bacterium]